jgi:acetyl-CoA synthetase
MTPTDRFREARDFLIDHRADYATAYARFRWPELPAFNWAIDWFDGELAAGPHHRGGCRDAQLR